MADLWPVCALVTDGRMSGASGKVPAAIHVCPEAADGGPLARVRDGDMIVVDAVTGRLEVEAADFETRDPAKCDQAAHHSGIGREMFDVFRANVGHAADGACVIF